MEKNFFDQSVAENNKITYEKFLKIANYQGDDYKTSLFIRLYLL